MALIPCPECKREVSDRAAACPHCGVAIAAAPSGGAPIGGFAAGTGAGTGAVPWVGTSGAAAEEVAWEGEPSSRLLAREVPGIAWALIAPPLLLWLLPAALRMVGGLHPDLRRAIREQGSTVQLLIVIAVLLLSLARLARAALFYARLRATHYRVTNQRLTVESGLFSKRIDDVDLRTVEDVALEQSALERVLDVGRLSILSTDRSRPRLLLQGIRSAREVRERVRASAYQASQRQLFTRAT
jgi:membrane protein YdbS with pleckstrin-like domain